MNSVRGSFERMDDRVSLETLLPRPAEGPGQWEVDE